MVPTSFRAAVGKGMGSMPMEAVVPGSVINSQKDSLVYLAFRANCIWAVPSGTFH